QLNDIKSIDQSQREFARGHELSQQRMTAAPLDFLPRQSSKKLFALLFSEIAQHGAVPGAHLRIHSDLLAPAGIEKIRPIFWRDRPIDRASVVPQHDEI